MPYAAIIQNGIVQVVYAVPDSLEATSFEVDSRTIDQRMTEHFNRLGMPGEALQTSYNANIRGKFAGIGDLYSAEFDIFTSPQPYPSWALTPDGAWSPPTPKPDDDNEYTWNEEAQDWEIVE